MALLWAILKWAVAPLLSAAVAGRIVIRPRLVVDFDPKDGLCIEPVGIPDKPQLVGVAIRVRVRHMFGLPAKGCRAKLVHLRRYDASAGPLTEESGGQPLPWKDRDTYDGIELRRGDVEYANVVQVLANIGNPGVALITKTARGTKRRQSLQPGIYACRVRIDADSGKSPTVTFGFDFSIPTKELRWPFLAPIEGSVRRTSNLRLWLGI